MALLNLGWHRDCKGHLLDQCPFGPKNEVKPMKITKNFVLSLLVAGFLLAPLATEAAGRKGKTSKAKQAVQMAPVKAAPIKKISRKGRKGAKKKIRTNPETRIVIRPLNEEGRKYFEKLEISEELLIHLAEGTVSLETVKAQAESMGGMRGGRQGALGCVEMGESELEKTVARASCEAGMPNPLARPRGRERLEEMMKLPTDEPTEEEANQRMREREEQRGFVASVTFHITNDGSVGVGDPSSGSGSSGDSGGGSQPADTPTGTSPSTKFTDADYAAIAAANPITPPASGSTTGGGGSAPPPTSGTTPPASGGTPPPPPPPDDDDDDGDDGDDTSGDGTTPSDGDGGDDKGDDGTTQPDPNGSAQPNPECMTEEDFEDAQRRMPGYGTTRPEEPELTGSAARFAACLFERENEARLNECPGDQVAYCEGETCTCRSENETGEGSPPPNEMCQRMIIDCSDAANQNSPCCPTPQ